MIRIRLFLTLLIVLAVVKHYAPTAINPDEPPKPPGPNNKYAVLILEETAPSPAYTPAQSLALASARAGEIRDWLNSNMGSGNHVFDKDVDLSKQTQLWRDAMARPPTTLPAVRYYNGRRWYAWKAFADTAELKTAIGMK